MTPDNSYIFPVSVAIISLLENADASTYYDLYILVSKNFSDKSKNILINLKNQYNNFNLNFIYIDEQIVQGAKKVLSCIPITANFRLLASGLLKQYSKCIYLDCDILVNTDLSELYHIEIADNYVAGVKDWGIQEETEANNRHRKELGLQTMDNYVNAGVLVMNLAQIRLKGLEEQFIIHINKQYLLGDQDVLNVCCFEKIKFLPLKYNIFVRYYKDMQLLCNTVYSMQEIEDAALKPGIIHFVGKNLKPWKNLRCKGSKLWWSYAKKCLFENMYADGLEQAQNWCMEIDWLPFVDKIKGQDNIVVFGFSDIGKALLKNLKKAGIIDIACFCDNDPDKQGKTFDGLEVISVDSAIDRYHDIFVINTSQLYYEEINEQLRTLGIESNRIICYNQKTGLYYMGLDKEYHDYELRELYLKEFGSKVLDEYNRIDISVIYEKLLTHSSNTANQYYLEKWILPPEKNSYTKNSSTI